MPNSRKTTIGNDAQDLIGAEVGEGASGITAGKDNSHASADVRIAMGRMADTTHLETLQLGELAREINQMRTEFAAHIAQMRAEFNALMRELLGNEKYAAPGLIQRLGNIEGHQVGNRLAWGLLALNGIIQWAVIIYWVMAR